MTTNQNLGAIPDGVADLETALTDIVGRVDAAMSENSVVNVTAGGTIALSDTDLTRANFIQLTGTPVAAFTLTVPATHSLPGTLKKLFVIGNLSGQDATVEVAGAAGASVVVSAATNAMLYTDGTDIHAFASGGSGSASFSGCLLEKTTTQSISNGVATAVIFDQVADEIWDTDGYHENVTNPTRLTAPATGKYRISAGIRFPSFSANTIIQINGAINGGAFPGIGGQQDLASNFAAASRILSWSRPVLLTAGQYVESIVFQNSGVARSLQADTATFFSIERLD
jgi:hypothetical protein